MAVTDLLASFEANAKESAAEVLLVGRAPERIRCLVSQAAQGATSIVLGLGEFLSAEIVTALREIPGVLREPSDEQLSTAQVGVNDGFAGVASTGSVCIAMGPPLVSTASLLMPLNIVILAAERIVAMPSDLFTPEYFGGEGLRRDLVFITGPSATADMGPLVRGVHGPHRLLILVIQ
jgi:L-lactate dehydrogenase complex protein LldG